MVEKPSFHSLMLSALVWKWDDFYTAFEDIFSLYSEKPDSCYHLLTKMLHCATLTSMRLCDISVFSERTLDMTVTLLSVFIVSVFVAILCIEIYTGAERGFHLSLISLGAVILSLFLSFLVTPMASAALASYLMSFLDRIDIYQDYVELLPSISSILLNVLTMLIGTVLFIFVFFIIFIIVKMIAFAVYRKRTVDDDSVPDRLSRMRGAVCGFLSAMILTMTLTAPIMGTLELADDSLYIVKQTSTQAYQALGPGNAAMVHSFTEDVSANVFYQNGGRLIYNSVSGVSVSGERVYLLSELGTIAGMSKDMLDVYMIFSTPQMATHEHTQALRRLSDDVQKLVLCKNLSADVIKRCARAWQKDEAFLSIQKPQINGVMNQIFIEILEVCANTNFTNVKENAATLLEAYAVILESGIFQEEFNDSGMTMNILQSDGTIGKLERVLSENPYMKNVNVSSIAAFALASYIEENVDGAREARLYEDIAEILRTVNGKTGTVSEKADAMAALLQEALKKEGISVNKTFSRYISVQLLQDLTGKNVSEKDVSRLFDQYVLRMQ